MQKVGFSTPPFFGGGGFGNNLERLCFVCVSVFFYRGWLGFFAGRPVRAVQCDSGAAQVPWHGREDPGQVTHVFLLQTNSTKDVKVE